MSKFESNKNEREPLNQTLAPQFLSATHRDLFFQHLNQLDEHKRTNPEYQAVFFIMTSDDELLSKMSPYVGSFGFRFQDMFDEVDFSSGYRLIAQAAADMFGQDYDTSLSAVIGALGHELFHTFLQALIIRKYGVNSIE